MKEGRNIVAATDFAHSHHPADSHALLLPLLLLLLLLLILLQLLVLLAPHVH
jgi:hypothetical protein